MHNNLILIVDDNKTMRLILAKTLQEAGFATIEVGSGEEAMEVFEHAKPDAVSLDLQLPGISGFEVCEMIRQHPEGSYIPVVIITGADDDQSINLAYQMGATDFVTKPVSLNLIGHRMRYIIRASFAFKDLKRSEDEVIKLNRNLEQRVIERTDELRQANGKLLETLETLKSAQRQLVESEKLAALGSLVAGVAHEINTPVGISVTAVSHLIEKVQKVVDEYQSHKALKRSQLENLLQDSNESLSLIQINLERASNLIKNFKQVSVDQVVEDLRHFELKSYLEKILFSLKGELKKANLVVQLNCPAQLWMESYPGAFFQIITILVVDSVQHAYDPGSSGTLKIDVTVDGDRITLVYQDDGKGIRPEDLNKVFDPFFTTKRGQGGTGLGLNIAHNLVTKLLEGSIACHSELGHGVVFILHLPKRVRPVIAADTSQ